MQAKSLLAWLILGTVVATVQAEEAPVPSAEAIRAVCEEAMPDLLQGNPKGWDGLRSVLDPQLASAFEALAFQFTQEHARFKDLLGEPIDWKYLGEKRIGSVGRQYFFVCRYAKAMRFWYFNTYEVQNRWLLISLVYNSDPSQILASLPNDPNAPSPTCVTVCGPTVEAIAHGKGEAAEQLTQLMVHQDPATVAFNQATLQRCQAEIAGFGRLLKCEPVYVRELDGWLAECCYAVQWEQSLRLIQFRLYRPDNDWQLLHWSIDSNSEPLLAKMSLEPSPVSLPRQAVRPLVRPGR